MPKGEFPGAEGVNPMSLGPAPEGLRSAMAGLTGRDAILDEIAAMPEPTPAPTGHHMAACVECGLLRPHPGTASMPEALAVAWAHMQAVGHGVLILRVVASLVPQR